MNDSIGRKGFRWIMDSYNSTSSCVPRSRYLLHSWQVTASSWPTFRGLCNKCSQIAVSGCLLLLLFDGSSTSTSSARSCSTYPSFLCSFDFNRLMSPADETWLGGINRPVMAAGEIGESSNFHETSSKGDHWTRDLKWNSLQTARLSSVSTGR